jgi:hypothetical protein
MHQAAFGLLFQSLEMGSDSAVSREDSKLLSHVVTRLEQNEVVGYTDLRRAVEALVGNGASKGGRRSETGKSDSKQKGSKRRPTKGAAVRSTPQKNEESTNSTVRTTFPYIPRKSRHSLIGNSSNTKALYPQNSLFARSEPSLSPLQESQKILAADSRRQLVPNLDYMPLNNRQSLALSLANETDTSGSTEWERLLSNLDNGPTNMYDGIYGGFHSQRANLGDYSSLASPRSKGMQSSNAGDAPSNSSCSPHSLWTPVPDFSNTPQVGVPQSVLSFGSDETAVMPGEDCFDAGVIMDSPVDAYTSNVGIQGMNSPALLAPTTDNDLFGGLDFGIGI